MADEGSSLVSSERNRQYWLTGKHYYSTSEQQLCEGLTTNSNHRQRK